MNGDLTCGSLFSGVGGMDIGLAWAGFRHAFFAEVDPYCRAVLAARFPGVPIYEDVRDVCGDVRLAEGDGGTGPRSPGHDEPDRGRGGDPRRNQNTGRLHLLAGGFPCQDLSVAGKRAGLAGERSGLFWEAMRVADALRPRAILLENVEGLYSSNGGRDFGVVLDALAERGFLVTWRTLDSQHFGVPQRRRRVFVLAIADGDSGAERIREVLALSESGGGDSPTSDPTWPLPAPGVAAGAGGGGRTVDCLSGRSASRLDDQCVGGGQLVTSADLRERESRERRDEHDSVRRRRLNGAGRPSHRGAEVVSALQGGGKRGYRIDAEAAAGGQLVAAYRKSARVSGPDTPETWVDDGIANTLNSFDVGDVRTTHAVVQSPTVRRLTPMECERLQGWPDGWTDVPWNGKEHAPDSRRYAACGNGVTAPVAYWIGARLREVLS